MPLFILSVATVIIVSALCSLTEASLYAVRMPYISKLTASGSRAGHALTKMKKNMDQPIAAILILNTVANTAGATVAGAQAQHLFGESALIWFSVFFTLTVLFFSEIVPKVLGVAYNRTIAPAVSLPLAFAIKGLYPLVWLSQGVSRRLQRGKPAPIAPEDEVRHLASLSAAEGSILPMELELVHNVLHLDQVKARDIMTPRTVVFTLPANATVRDVLDQVSETPHARIPIHVADDPENWVGVVLRVDILSAMARDRFDETLESLKKPLGFVPEVMPGHKLLTSFIARRAHLLCVVDEYGGVAGVVSLEDVIESLLGREIVDETDADVDMQAVARQRSKKRFRLRDRDKNDESPKTDG